MSGFPNLADLPKEITNINSEEVLINVLSHMYFNKLIEWKFKIQDGFIYKYSTVYFTKILIHIPLRKIECIYELYRQNNQKVPYKDILDKYDKNYSPKYKQSYFIFKGSYKVLTNMIVNDEYNNLIFPPVEHGTHTIQTNSGYSPFIVDFGGYSPFIVDFGGYSPFIVNFGGYYHVPWIYNGAVKQFEPIKFNYKFSRLLRASSNGIFHAGGNYRYAIDPFDADVSFICADTFDIVNPETGRRVKDLDNGNCYI